MSEYQKPSDMLCLKCNVPLVDEKADFSYLGFNFNTVLPRCPVCRQVYISEELVKGKMSEVETNLEDK